jgi:iron complex outermembrane receptor protein
MQTHPYAIESFTSMRALTKTALSCAVVAALCTVSQVYAQQPGQTLTGSEASQAAATGSILGRVYDPSTGGYLRNARIKINGRQVATSADRGEFRINGVAAGSVLISVEYTGFGTRQQEVAVRAGETSEPLFEMYSTLTGDADVVGLDTVQVVGAREGDARAIMEQRASMNITNTLSADSFGEIADGNPGEFLKYMPGVDFDVVADDAPRNISLRGLPAKYTGVTLNGISLPGIDANSSSSRTFSFEQSALAGVDSINIYKTTSADMDANAPAGTIDIRTKRAFDANGRRISVSVAGNTHAGLWDGKNTGWMEGGYSSKFLPSTTINYSDVFMDGRLGVAAGISSVTSLVEQTQITSGRNYVATAASPSPYAVTSIAAAGYDREYNRRVAQLGLDFKASDELILSLAASVSRGDIDPNTITPTFSNSRASSGDPSLDWTTRYPASTKTLNTNNTYTYKLGYSRNFMPSFVWQNERFKLDGTLFSAQSESRYSSGKKGQVSDVLNDVTSTGNYSASRSDWMHQDWQIQQLSGPDWALPESYTLGTYAGALGNSTRPSVRTTSGSRADLDYRGGALNFEFYQDIGNVPVTWKTGLKSTQADYTFGNTSDANIRTYDGPLSNTEFLQAVQSGNEWHAGSSGMDVKTLGGGDLYVYSLGKIYDLMQANPEQWLHAMTPARWYNANTANANKMDENINSAYFMGTAEFTDKLKVQAGLRWEQTRTTSYDFSPLGKAELAAAGHAFNATTGRATTIEGLEYQYMTNPLRKNQSSYNDFFPSASMKYSFSDGFDLQLGYSRTILRPEVSDLAGVWSINYGTEDGNVLSAPNVNLRPEYSDNLSLRVVKYFEPVGLIGFGVFHNKIKDLISDVDMTPGDFGYSGDEAIDLVSTRANLEDDISVNGYEFEFNHAMDYLPGALGGLTVRGSFTHTNPSVVMPRVAQQVANLGLAWRHKRARLSVNTVWSDEKDRGLTGNITNAVGNVINQKQPFDDYLEVNLSGSYTIVPKRKDGWFSLDAFFSVNNLFDQNRHTVYSNGETGLGQSGHHSQIYITSGRRGSIGLRARF